MRAKLSIYSFRAMIAVAVSALALALVSVPAEAASASPNVVSPLVSSTSSLSAADYWTPARMAAAIPADALVPAGVGKQFEATPLTPSGTPTTVEPTGGSLGAGPNSLLAAVGVARPYTNFPDRLNGKVFFSKGGLSYVCSGTVVNGTNKDLVDTAGHCVSDGAGHFHSNWIFVPAYSSAATGCTTTSGCYPYGRWSARLLTTRTEWHTYANLKQDYGYAVLNTLGGQHIVNRLGGQGSTFNQSRTQTYRAYGYPQAAPFNGYDQKVCVSGWLANDNPSTRSGPLTIKINCNLTGGSSGGGWLIRLAASGLGYVNSHNSYGYTGQPGFMYGPYYGSEALSLFNSAKVL